jgi:tRNA threonylcarbamoyladenosine biosynthesis protein TsaE
VATRIVETSGSRQTEALGAEIAAELSRGDIVLVRGELGAGKTTLVRGAARALGVSGPVTSPTFAIGHRYEGSGVTVSHLDLYRLAGLHEEEPALLDDYLGPSSIAFVEWPIEGSPELQEACLMVTLTHLGMDCRRIEVRDLDEHRGGVWESDVGASESDGARESDVEASESDVGASGRGEFETSHEGEVDASFGSDVGASSSGVGR